MLRPALIGPLGPPALACLRSWNAQNWKPIFIHLGESRIPSFMSGLVAAYLHLPDDVDASTRIIRINDFLREQSATGLTCVSYHLAAWLRGCPLPAGVDLWLPSAESIAVLRSKGAQLEIARAVGLPVLDSYRFRATPVAEVDPSHFPLVLRPDDEAKIDPLFKMELVRNPCELASFLASRTRMDCDVIGQPFIRGPNLVVHGARTRDGEDLGHVGFLASRKFGGTSLTVEPAAVAPHIVEGCRAFAEKMGHVGIYHFELLLSPETGSYYFLEINGRFGGTTGKVLVYGYDEPRRLVEAFNNHMPYSYIPKSAHFPCGNKRRTAKALLEAIRGRQSPFDYPNHRPMKNILVLTLGFLAWRDEIFRTGHCISALGYMVHESEFMRRIRKSIAGLQKQHNGQPDSITIGQKILKAGLGRYQIFHVLKCTQRFPRSPDRTDMFSFASSKTEEGYRFRLVNLNDNGVDACRLGFWTARKSLQERNFVPLKSDEAELVFLETPPAYRNRGLARMLVGMASDYMLSEGYRGLYARVWHSNVPSLRALSNAGWRYAYTMIEIYPFGKRIRFRGRFLRRRL